MKLIFGALAILVTVTILLSGSVVFWLTNSTLDQTKQDSVKSLASGLAYSISSQMQLFEKTVEQIANDAEVAAAVESGDATLMENTANRLQKFLPVALKIRVLPASVNAVDERQTPVMGYADLEMVKKTLTSKQTAIIQGEGNNRHLAVTAGIKKGGQVIGVVLASLEFDFIKEILAKAPIHEDFIEISQGTVGLGSGGDPAVKANNPQQFNVANSSWQISYAAADAHEFADLGIMMGVVTGLVILACAALFFAYFYMAKLLKTDQDTVLEAVKHLMTGKELGNYDVKLNEMQVIVSTLVQFKRILDNRNGNSEEKAPEPAKNINFDAMFADDDDESQVRRSVEGMLKKKK